MRYEYVGDGLLSLGLAFKPPTACARKQIQVGTKTDLAHLIFSTPSTVCRNHPSVATRGDYDRQEMGVENPKCASSLPDVF